MLKRWEIRIFFLKNFSVPLRLLKSEKLRKLIISIPGFRIVTYKTVQKKKIFYECYINLIKVYLKDGTEKTGITGNCC